jgi:type VI secretion system secreted protein Hcp
MGVLDLFLKIDGIEGECQDIKHRGELQLTSASNAVVHQPYDVSGSGDAGHSIWPDAQFTMFLDKAYTKLFSACTTGEHIKKAVLTWRKAGKDQQEFLKVTYTDVLVSMCRLNGGGGPGKPVPVLSFSFNFAQIEEEYKAQKGDGTLGGAIKYSYSIPKTAKGE